MTKFLSIAMGNSARDAEAVFVSDDQELIELFLACMLKRLELLERQGKASNAVYAN